MTAEFFKYFNQILMQLFIYWSEFQPEIELGAFKTDQFQGRRRHQNSSKKFKEFISHNEMATEFFKNFDQIGYE